VVPDGAQWYWKTINNIVVCKHWYNELHLYEEMQEMQIEFLLGVSLKVFHVRPKQGWKNKSKTGECIMWMVV